MSAILWFSGVLMHLVPIAVLSVLMGCAVPPGPSTKPDGDSSPLVDTASGIDTAAPSGACVLHDVEPRTLPASSGGTVKWTWRCPQPVEVAGVWSVPLPDGSVPADATAEDDLLRLEAVVPAEWVSPGAHALGGPVQDDRVRTDLELPLRVHADPSVVADGLAGRGWNTWGGVPAESASFFLGDTDDNRQLDLLGTMLEPDGDVIQTSQQADGLGILQVRRGVAHTSDTGVFTSGGGTWVDAGDGAVMALVGGTEPGHVMHVRQSTWQDRDWVITVLRINHGFMRERVPDLLLGMETIWRSPELPDVDLLGVVDRGAGPLGLACENTNCWEWSRLGGVSAADVVDGTGFVGMFVGGELSRLQERTREPLFWSVSRPKPDGAVQVVVSEGDERVRRFSTLRTVELAVPGFPLEAVSSAAEDLDGDGDLELILELWGAGGWSAWLIPDADDRFSTRIPIALGEIRTGAVWTAPGPTAMGASAMLETSFSLNARALRATMLRADGQRVSESASAHLWVAEWDPLTLLSGADEVPPIRADIGGLVDLPESPCTAPSGEALPACRGTWVARGVGAAGDVGSSQPEDAYTAGDHLLVVPGAGHTRVLVGRGMHPSADADPAPVASVGTDGDAWLTGDAGLRVRTALGEIERVCHGAIQAADGAEGPILIGQTEEDCVSGESRYTVWDVDEPASLEVVGGDHETSLTLLHEDPTETGWPVFWRRGDGQAWWGWLDLEADPPAWADTPEPLGAPVNAEVLGIGAERRAVVQLSESSGVPLALDDAWTRGPGLPGPVGTRATIVAVGDSTACGHAVVLERGGDIAPLFESEDATCADLPLPQTAIRLGDGEALVALAADGTVWLSRLTGEDALHRIVDTGMSPAAVPGPRARVEAGDLNGDGIDDLLLLGWLETPPRALLLDGHGGRLPAASLDDAELLLNVAGLARPAVGRPAPTRSWDAALPLVQRRIVSLGDAE